MLTYCTCYTKYKQINLVPRCVTNRDLDPLHCSCRYHVDVVGFMSVYLKGVGRHHKIFATVFGPENILYFTLKEFHLVSLVLEIMNFCEFRQVTQLCLALASILPA